MHSIDGEDKEIEQGRGGQKEIRDKEREIKRVSKRERMEEKERD